MLPKQGDIEIPLLRVLNELGGQAKTDVVYNLLTSKFPQITADDLTARLGSGGNKWKNRVRWVRQRLVGAGEIKSLSRGLWDSDSRIFRKGMDLKKQKRLRKVSKRK